MRRSQPTCRLFPSDVNVTGQERFPRHRTWNNQFFIHENFGIREKKGLANSPGYFLSVMKLTRLEVLWISQSSGCETWDLHHWCTPSQRKDDPIHRYKSTWLGNNVSWFVHLHETWLENTVSWFVQLHETWLRKNVFWYVHLHETWLGNTVSWFVQLNERGMKDGWLIKDNHPTMDFTMDLLTTVWKQQKRFVRKAGLFDNANTRFSIIVQSTSFPWTITSFFKTLMANTSCEDFSSASITYFAKFFNIKIYHLLIVEYYLHWTTTFEISFSGSSDTNRDSLL